MSVATVCLAVILIGLIFPATRRFAIAFGWFVFGVLVVAGIGVLGYVGWLMAPACAPSAPGGRRTS